MSYYHVHKSTLGGIIVTSPGSEPVKFDRVEEAQQYANAMNEAYDIGYIVAVDNCYERITSIVDNMLEAVEKMKGEQS